MPEKVMTDEEMMADEEMMMVVRDEGKKAMVMEKAVVMEAVEATAPPLRICRDREAEDGRGGQSDSNFFQHGSLLFSPLYLSPFPL